MLFIIIHNSIYNMLFNYTPYPLLSLIFYPRSLHALFPYHSALSLSPSRSLSWLSLLISLSLCSLRESREIEREAERDREREREHIEIGRERDSEETEQKEKREIRGEKAYMCLETENHHLEMTLAELPRRRTTRGSSSSFVIDQRKVRLLLSSRHRIRR